MCARCAQKNISHELLHALMQYSPNIVYFDSDGPSAGYAAHKVLLCARSCVFRAMFEPAAFKEGHQAVVKLHQISKHGMFICVFVCAHACACVFVCLCAVLVFTCVLVGLCDCVLVCCACVCLCALVCTCVLVCLCFYACVPTLCAFMYAFMCVFR